MSFDRLPNFQLHFDYSLLSFFLYLLVFRYFHFEKKKSLSVSQNKYFQNSCFFIFLDSTNHIIFCSVHLSFRCLLCGWVHSHTWTSTCQAGRVPRGYIPRAQGRVPEGLLSPLQWWRGSWRRVLTAEFCLVRRLRLSRLSTISSWLVVPGHKKGSWLLGTPPS